jgi:hypothetical protein
MHDSEMARLEDMDEQIGGYLRFLKEAYYATDPNKGEGAELSKLDVAQLAIELVSARRIA